MMPQWGTSKEINYKRGDAITASPIRAFPLLIKPKPEML
jgi:hypothetical protein